MIMMSYHIIVFSFLFVLSNSPFKQISLIWVLFQFLKMLHVVVINYFPLLFQSLVAFFEIVIVSFLGNEIIQFESLFGTVIKFNLKIFSKRLFFADKYFMCVIKITIFFVEFLEFGISFYNIFVLGKWTRYFVFSNSHNSFC